MQIIKDFRFHCMAIITVIIWGTTFVSTKILIQNGLDPTEIFLYRFILAYLCIWCIAPRTLWAETKKDELLFAASGLSGGSLYFIAENTALGITLASNVSLIICTAPILTTLLSLLFFKDKKVNSNVFSGSFIALAGVALVVFNGSFILKINPIGDFLTLIAALMWAFYCLILQQLDQRYSTLFITRKVFFYGIVTLIPIFIIHPIPLNYTLISEPVILINLLFLGIVASMICYISWNVAMKHLGALRTANYIYIVPLVTLLTSAIVLNEPITAITLIGSLLILLGVYMAEKNKM